MRDYVKNIGWLSCRQNRLMYSKLETWNPNCDIMLKLSHMVVKHAMQMITFIQSKVSSAKYAKFMQWMDHIVFCHTILCLHLLIALRSKYKQNKCSSCAKAFWDILEQWYLFSWYHVFSVFCYISSLWSLAQLILYGQWRINGGHSVEISWKTQM